MKVIDVSGDLVVDSVKVDGGEADIDKTEVTVKVSNKFTEALIDIEGTKTWVDKDDADKLRPVSITIRLFADGEEIDKVIVTAKDGWKYKFTDLPKYKGEKEIVYTISEDMVKGYVTTIKGYDVINTHDVPKTGDDANVLLWTLSMFTSAMLMGGAVMFGRKKREED